MNYDEFKDLYDMRFHGKLYTVILKLYQYTDTDTKKRCIKAEVYDPEDEGLKTIKAPIEEFTFPKRKATCKTCVYQAKGYCHKFETSRNKGNEACDDYLECDE
ncbi:hypothetical protein MKC69_21845 [[Clostridium] innocuum]|uniref:hypothetical protein n=1 Tax=Clostridium innocuum TaxID=1522 RepID=UPI001F59091F|nr:hypothetical protein [[Clostridium] innocuum]MCI3002152.1 hypothetical protein [[Clostridium] innocuum]MCR0180420.1 hypothetical protein [[Clostridium] innocuum]MCR0211086.1 hypothetical protein [[Clostridium] innocuum]MCR0257284.1 hypothetical protein [[Clostridium] innocuum]MCR0424246.1 hypothetical protein [[Clostridium] innocuum]